MKAIIFSEWFKPPDELLDFCKTLDLDIEFNEFTDWSNNAIRFNKDIIEFCEDRISENNNAYLWNEKVYKGKESSLSKIGFSGAGYIRDIDISKNWILKSNYVDAPIVKYVNVNIDKYGQVKII